MGSLSARTLRTSRFPTALSWFNDGRRLAAIFPMKKERNITPPENGSVPKVTRTPPNEEEDDVDEDVEQHDKDAASTFILTLPRMCQPWRLV